MIWYGMIWYDMIWYDMIWYHGHHQGTSLKMCFLTKPLREALIFAASKSSHGNLKIIKLEIQKKTPLWNLQMSWDFRPSYRITYLSISIPFFGRFCCFTFLPCWNTWWRSGNPETTPDVLRGCVEAYSSRCSSGASKYQETLAHNMCIQIHSMHFGSKCADIY